MEITEVTIPDPQGLEQHSESLSETELEAITEQTDEVATVADEILVEVKECRTKQEQQQAALESLLSEGGPAKQTQVTALELELRNTREELRNLLSELKTLSSPNPNPPGPVASSQSTPLPSVQTQEVVMEIDPVEDARPVARTGQRKKRYRI